MPRLGRRQVARLTYVRGVAAPVVANELNAEPVAYTVTGFDATLPSAYSINAVPGSYTVTGVAATVVADRVLDALPRLNLVRNPTFEQEGTTGWIGFNGGTISRSIEQAYHGQTSLKIIAASAGDGAQTTGLYVVQPSQWYYTSIFVYSEAGMTARLTTYEYDSGVNLVSESGTNHSIPAATWTGFNISEQLTSTTVWMQLSVTAPDEAETFYLDAVQLERAFITDFSLGGVTVAAPTTVLAGPGFSLDAQPGSYSVTGAAATVVAGRLLNAEPGSYTVTGFVTDLVHGIPGQYVFNAEPGTYSITGVAATLLYAHLFPALAGSFTVTGSDSDLVLNDLVLVLNDHLPDALTLTDHSAGVLRLDDHFDNGGPAVAVTTAGEEITDATRAANVEGDGRQYDSSYGLWTATTNLITNGGFESGLTGWSAWESSCTLAQATDDAVFGGGSLRATTLLTTPALAQFIPGDRVQVTGGLPYTLSAYVKTVVGNRNVEFDIDWYSTLSGAGYISTSFIYESIPAGWSRLDLAATAPANAVSCVLYIGPGGTGSVGDELLIDGVQFEQKAFATPYVHTDGATASRSNGRVAIAPGTMLDKTQGWVAVRMRMGRPSTWEKASYVFDWIDDPLIYNDYIAIWYANAADAFALERGDLPSFQRVDSAVQTFVSGDYRTVVAAWTATQIKISVDGSLFTTASATTIPSTLRDVINVGMTDAVDVDGEHYLLNGDILWFACGTGTLTDADAADLGELGEENVNLDFLPETADTQLAWAADNEYAATWNTLTLSDI